MTAERQIWKFPVSSTETRIEVPYGAVLRHVGIDPAGGLAVWYEVNTSAPKMALSVRVYGTGQPIDIADKWLGTVRDGPFMWHLYSTEIS